MLVSKERICAQEQKFLHHKGTKATKFFFVNFVVKFGCVISLLLNFAVIAQPDSTSGGTRRIRPVGEDSSPYNFERWAIIVGISKYKHANWNLQYAHRDADSLYKLIQTPSGGGFKKDKIKLMIDSAATTASITRALRGFLKKPARDDLVLIYFACHGGPDPDRPETLYLITHDTDPAEIAGTALPMREVNSSLQENLLAERVVIIADVCHSAAISSATRRLVIDSAAVLNTYFRNAGKAKGVALLTSAESRETAQEGIQWGGGHGVFTYYLLEGMRGNADVRGLKNNRQKDGIVTVGELFEYVRENVKKATGDQQHPFVGPDKFDRDLPMAISGGITAQEHYQLGCQLYEMGFRLDDPKRFKSANQQFQEALRLIPFSDNASSEVNLRLGRSLLALGKYGEAVQALQAANKDQKYPEAFFYAGVGNAKQQQYQKAAAFAEFLKQRPQDDYAPCVKEYTGWLANRPKTGRKYALLIGSSDYPIDSPTALVERPHDVQLMKQVLLLQHGFQDSNIVTLIGKNAARQDILSAFDRYSHAITINDTIVIFFSDRSNTAETHFLQLRESGEDSSGGRISATDLHYLLEGIPTTNKTFILDSTPLPQLLSLARKEGGYALFMAATPGQIANANPIFKDKSVGAFTFALAKKLRESPSPETTFGQIADAMMQEFNNDSTRARYGAEQTPLFIGNRERRLFAGDDYYLGLFDFALRKSFTAITPEFLKQQYQWLQRQVTAPFPAAHYNFGRAFLAQRNYMQAQEALQAAINQRNGKYPEAQLALGILQVYMQNYAGALASFKTYFSTLESPGLKAQMQKPVDLVETLARPRKHALLIGIDDYANPELTDLRGAVNDVQALKAILSERGGFRKENIHVLLNRQASRQGILQALTALSEKLRRHEPALFYFAGYGSKTIYGHPTIVSADGRQPGVFDISLQELSSLLPASANLLTIIDAGCGASTTGNRSLAPDKQPFPDKPASQYPAKIGLISIYPGTMSAEKQPEIFDLEFSYTGADAKPRYHGELTQALLQSLDRAAPLELTYAQLYDSTAQKIFKPSLPPVALGDSLQIKRKLFSHSPALADSVHALVTNIERSEPIDEAIRILLRLNHQRNEIYPEGYLNLGVAYAAKGEYGKSLFYLEEASIETNPNYNPEAHYHLGRVLLESGTTDLEKAASELRQAIKQEPDNIPAHYYFGKTIQALIERGLWREAEKHWRTYLEYGAPLGFDDEVQAFLEARQARRQRR